MADFYLNFNEYDFQSAILISIIIIIIFIIFIIISFKEPMSLVCTR